MGSVFLKPNKVNNCRNVVDRKKNRVLMVGPARDVKGGMTTVVNNYFECGLQDKVDLKYIESANDKNIILKFIKEKQGLREFRKNVRNYDIVHIHVASRRSTFRKIKYIRIANREGKKIILHMHGAEYRDFYDKECDEEERNYIKSIFALVDYVIVLSVEWKEFYTKIVDEEKIVIQSNSVILPPNYKKSLNKKNMLFLGRLGHRKGIYDLLDVISTLIKDFPDLFLYIGGDGEIERVLKYIHKKNLDNFVEYDGWIGQPEKEVLLKESSIYILPSYDEGMPMSVLEAMSYKNVVISTDVGGIPQVIKNGINGLLVKPGDKTALRSAIITLFNDASLREKLSNKARETIEKHFDAKKELDELTKLYEEVVEINKVNGKDNKGEESCCHIF